MTVPKQQNSFPLRMPAALRSRLEVRAKENGRSANSEIVAMLTDVLDEQKRLSDEAPASALSALGYRIAILEAELTASRGSLADLADFISTLISLVPPEVKELPGTKATIKYAQKAANHYRMTEDEKASLDAEHVENFKKAVKLIQETHRIQTVRDHGASAPAERLVDDDNIELPPVNPAPYEPPIDLMATANQQPRRTRKPKN